MVSHGYVEWEEEEKEVISRLDFMAGSIICVNLIIKFLHCVKPTPVSLFNPDDFHLCDGHWLFMIQKLNNHHCTNDNIIYRWLVCISNHHIFYPETTQILDQLHVMYRQ